jgi:predicted dehydrogenase
MSDIRLIVVDPGHFHAALVQKEMYPNLSPKVPVYAPVGPDLADYLTRIARFNTRKEQPTHWQLEVHAGPDFLERMCRESPGSVVIFSGRNRGKVQRILSAVEAGINVLADKPLIVDRQELPVLKAALNAADSRGLIIYDMSSGGRQATMAALTRLLREDPEVFGDPVPGTRTDPGVTTASVHHIMKQVAGVPNLRPPWFFDITQQGESLADVGTHLVDRVHSTLFPEQAIDYQTDIRLHEASRWPTTLSASQFRQVTGEAGWPDYLEPRITEDALEYFCNNRLQYEIRGFTLQSKPGGTGRHEWATIHILRAIAAAVRDWSFARVPRRDTGRNSTSCRLPILPLPSSAGLQHCREHIRASVSSSFTGSGE